jgi:hypothetical protein
VQLARDELTDHVIAESDEIGVTRRARNGRVTVGG